ncbi:TAM domain methyltransferase [Acephala macrosclerotiorum]|nr:TAM domain methyltransferase [Acephala macrosclerotiorum]
MKYREEHGRRYHGYKDGAYLLPNDEAEQDRLDLHHQIFTMVYDGQLYEAPINNPGRVLDVGTGTGIWAIDFADMHPESHILGSDLSPIQPQWLPPNLEFIVDDAEDEWIGQKYDYIHIRMLAGAIKDWPNLLARAFAHLNPGGYIECTEFEVWVRDFEKPANSRTTSADDASPPKLDEATKDEENPTFYIEKWQSGLSEAANKIGQTFDVAVNLKKWIIEAGFENVVEKVVKVPNTPWAKGKMKKIGLYQQQNMLDASSSYGQAHFTRVLGWSVEEYNILSAKVRKELKDGSLRLYSDLYKVYGQKPLEK